MSSEESLKEVFEQLAAEAEAHNNSIINAQRIAQKERVQAALDLR